MHRIEGALGLSVLPELVAAWRDRLAEGDLAIDLTALKNIDAAGFQALLSARAEATLRGRTLSLDLPEDGPVSAMLARLGLEPAFETARRAQSPKQETT
jgi:ABC-type transporter Mla MlaB component